MTTECATLFYSGLLTNNSVNKNTISASVQRFLLLINLNSFSVLSSFYHASFYAFLEFLFYFFNFFAFYSCILTVRYHHT